MYLAYADDSGASDKTDPFLVMAAVIIRDENFTTMEVLHGASVEAIVPADKVDSFQEFHAHELYGGFGIFAGVPQQDRFFVIQALLHALSAYHVPIVFGAVDKKRLSEKVYGSADALDICFRICVEGIVDWIGQFISHELVVLIVDDYPVRETKSIIRNSFRNLRRRVRKMDAMTSGEWGLHDDMYFGSSVDSVGIQLADLCAYFIKKHLRGGDAAAEGFYKIIEGQIHHSQLEPK